jgi:hypothetical protein
MIGELKEKYEKNMERQIENYKERADKGGVILDEPTMKFWARVHSVRPETVAATAAEVDEVVIEHNYDQFALDGSGLFWDYKPLGS